MKEYYIKYAPLAIAALLGSSVTALVLANQIKKATEKDMETTNRIMRAAIELSYDLGYINGKNAQTKQETAAQN